MLGRLPTELCFDAAELDAHRQRLQQETGIASPTAMAALRAPTSARSTRASGR